MRRELHFGDNLEVMRDRTMFPDASVDLIYLDPPFNSNATYNMLFKDKAGEKAEASIAAFLDTWAWGPSAEEAFDDVVKGENIKAGQLLKSLRAFLGDNDMMAYVAMMAVRLIEIARILKSTGSVYLHCDPTASHYLKLVLDSIFSTSWYRAEIIWKRTNARGTQSNWPHIHDTIFQYAAPKTKTKIPRARGSEHRIPHTLIIGPDGKKYQTYELTGAGTTKSGQSGKPWRGFNPNVIGRHWGNTHEQMDTWASEGKIHFPKDGGFPRRKDDIPFDPQNRLVTVGDIWSDIDRLNQTAKERLGYPTQKPLALLERIIEASSNPGDVILDPFCGCGTAVDAAEKLGRQWIGIDITHLAVNLIERRLKDRYAHLNERGAYKLYGVPQDFESAEKLARERPDQFEKWSVSLIPGARNYRLKGADGGIDGILQFRVDNRTYRRAILSVKGGKNIQVGMIRDLRGVIEREDDCELGLFISLHEPSKPMISEAAAAGFYELLGQRIPRLQIVTIRDLLAGKGPILPRTIDAAQSFRAAPREETDKGQGDLLDED